MEKYQKLNREQMKNIIGGLVPPEYHYECYCWSQSTGNIPGTVRYYNDYPSTEDAEGCSTRFLSCETFNPIVE